MLHKQTGKLSKGNVSYLVSLVTDSTRMIYKVRENLKAFSYTHLTSRFTEIGRTAGLR